MRASDIGQRGAGVSCVRSSSSSSEPGGPGRAGGQHGARVVVLKTGHCDDAVGVVLVGLERIDLPAVHYSTPHPCTRSIYNTLSAPSEHGPARERTHAPTGRVPPSLPDPRPRIPVYYFLYYFLNTPFAFAVSGDRLKSHVAY